MKKIFIKFFILGQVIIIVAICIYIWNSQNKTVFVQDIKPGVKVINETLAHYYELPRGSVVEPFMSTAPRRATYDINQQGLHDLYDYDEKKRSDVRRIITLGDSFTFGLYIDTADNWTEQLEQLLNQTTCGKYEVINLGVYGYDFRYAYERYFQLGQKYDPDLVIWLFADADRINEALFSKIDTTKQITYETLTQAKKKYMREWNTDEIISYQSAVFEEFNLNFSQNQILFTMPWYSKEFMNSIQHIHKEYPAFSYSKNIEHIVSDKKFLFENDGHPNSKGHDAIAIIVAKEILKKLPPICLGK